MTQEFRIRKLANKFSAQNRPSEQIGGVALDAVERYRKKYGGIWVGGVVELTDKGVLFSANALNRVLHSGSIKTQVPINKIRSVRREFGWLTGIVVIQHDGGEFRFRCFGAKNVAKRYSAYLASL